MALYDEEINKYQTKLEVLKKSKVLNCTQN